MRYFEKTQRIVRHAPRRRMLLIAFATILVTLTQSLTAQTKRRVLMEIFSTELCNQCPQAHKNIERLFGNGGDSIIMLGHHAGFYTDDFSLPESVDYEWFYSPNRGTYAPAAMMDRTCGSDQLPNVFQDGVPMFDGSKASCLQPAYAMAADIPAYAKVKAEVSYDVPTRLLTAKVSGYLMRQLPTVSDMRLNVFLAEDSVFTQLQSGSYGSYYHRHLARHCFTTTWGEAVAMDEDFERTYTLTLPDDWNAAKVEVIAFLTNYNPDDRNNCQVLNATSAPAIEPGTEGIAPIRPDKEDKPHAAYNLFGQRIKAIEHKGLQIQDGQIRTIR